MNQTTSPRSTREDAAHSESAGLISFEIPLIHRLLIPKRKEILKKKFNFFTQIEFLFFQKINCYFRESKIRMGKK